MVYQDFKTVFFGSARFSLKCLFGFGGGLEIGGIPKGTNHAFSLWFSRVAVSSDRLLFRKRPPIEMIEMVEMIEMIEMCLGRLGGVALRGWGAPVRGSSG